MASSAGPHGNTTYPAILQRLLDEKVGAGAYEVSMFALGGTTMSRTGDKPYWDTQEFDAFVARGRWDTVVVMLGTNDAKDAADGGPANWQHDCGGALDPSTPTLGGCSYAIDYGAFLRVASALGNPRVLVAAPPPLMQAKAYGMVRARSARASTPALARRADPTCARTLAEPDCHQHSAQARFGTRCRARGSRGAYRRLRRARWHAWMARVLPAELPTQLRMGAVRALLR